MIQLGAILIIFGFGSLILEQFDMEFRVLSWAHDMQPVFGIILGIVGVLLVGAGVAMKARQGKSRSSATDQWAAQTAASQAQWGAPAQGPDTGAQQPGQWDPPAGNGPSLGQYPTQGQYPAQSQAPASAQFPGRAQFPSSGQVPALGQYPLQGQYPTQGQYPAQSQAPASAQFPGQGQYPAQQGGQGQSPYNQGQSPVPGTQQGPSGPGGSSPHRPPTFDDRQ